jgi:peptidoglycan/xylan/chitin deacetylase (PgdA/CDA1 family)
MRVQSRLTARINNKWQSLQASYRARRGFRLRPPVPYISFTFDDFPRSALVTGGRILEHHNVRGTYFVSLKMVGKESPSGRIVQAADIVSLLASGHQLGCHTFDHLDGRRASADAFEQSIAANQAALERLVPGTQFQVFAYPLNGPNVTVKRAVGRRFIACRGGGQSINSGLIDLNLLRAFFLDRRITTDLRIVEDIISLNAERNGWLIFATHDVGCQPSPYGCDPQFFDAVVQCAVRSGARVVPMMQACEELQIAPATD